ncbi:hypothetical protein BAD_1554 [Bifidobacterium adolescentis ATCC 15703]|uniref:Uncharacterized protein n=1 Tax=Bifidobacterium adolescentis (strain ATCC 15703 / DSM 20083 / NCTC 11814 / E194a) TaxID=367928 RepID=A1A3Q2_BIFAA|nr:hypothetical protein BAD_1554 [Bifidobacterium adolescentis ATCC 15703]
MCHDPEKQPKIRIVLHIRGCGNTNSAPAIKTSTIHRSKKTHEDTTGNQCNYYGRTDFLTNVSSPS